MADFKNSNWYLYIEEPMKDLARQSYELLERERELAKQLPPSVHNDYAFIVFPMAKAYEGFLKKLFLDMGLITKKQYAGEYFRIGKALNPNLPKRLRFGWVYERLVSWCGGNENLAKGLWDVWKKARNKIFHFFPGHEEFVTLDEAGELVEDLARAMDMAVKGCKV